MLGISGVGQDRSLAVGNVVAVGVDEFEHIRCCADQDAVAQHANSQRRVDVSPLIEDLSLVHHPILVGVLEDQDPVTLGPLPIVAAIIDHLAYPHTTAMIDVEIGQTLEHGLRGCQCRLHPIGNRQSRYGILRGSLLERCLTGPDSGRQSLGGDVKLGGRRAAPILCHSSLIQSTTYLEPQGVLGQIKHNRAVGMRTDAAHYLIENLQLSSTRIGVLANLPPLAACRDPVLLQKGDLPRLGHQHRLDPIGPIACESVIASRNDHVQLLDSLDIHIGIDAMTRCLGGQHRRAKEQPTLGFGGCTGFLADRDSKLFGDAGRVEVPRYRFVLVFDQLGGRSIFDDRSFGGYIDMRCPENRIGNQSSRFGASPIPVEMATGVAEPTAAIGVLAGPSHMLRLFLGHRTPHVRVAAMGSIGPVHGALRSDRREDRRDSLEILSETHVKVPLVARFKRFDTPGDRMLG